VKRLTELYLISYLLSSRRLSQSLLSSRITTFIAPKQDVLLMRTFETPIIFASTNVFAKRKMEEEFKG